MFLSEPELKQLTGLPRSRQDARKLHLAKMGLRYAVSARGELVVSRSAVEGVLGAVGTVSKQPDSPNWDAVR